MSHHCGIYTDNYFGLIAAYHWMCDNNIGTKEQQIELQDKISENVVILYESKFGEPINQYDEVNVSIIYSTIYDVLGRSLQMEHEYELLSKMLHVANVKEEDIQECKKLVAGGCRVNFGGLD